MRERRIIGMQGESDPGILGDGNDFAEEKVEIGPELGGSGGLGPNRSAFARRKP